MKKAICFSILIGCVFFLPSVAVAQSPTGKGITQEGIKRGDHLQRLSPTEILSLIAPSTGMSLDELLDLYQNGSITMHNVQESNGTTRVEIRNFGTLITTLTAKCNTCGQGGPPSFGTDRYRNKVLDTEPLVRGLNFLKEVP